MGSKEVAAAAVKVAITQDRHEEKAVQEGLSTYGIQSVAIDFGGEFISSITKIIEKAIVAARREGLIDDTHTDEGAVAGAAKEAVSQIMNKAIGLNVGGKIAVARSGEHISVAVFFGIGLLHLNEVAVGVGHRVL